MSATINRSRRDLLAVGVLAVGWRRAAFAARASADAPPAPLSELAYGQVRFGAGPLERQARENHRLVLGLDEDALLRPFRLRAGCHLWTMDERTVALLRDHRRCADARQSATPGTSLRGNRRCPRQFLS